MHFSPRLDRRRRCMRSYHPNGLHKRRCEKEKFFCNVERACFDIRGPAYSAVAAADALCDACRASNRAAVPCTAMG